MNIEQARFNMIEQQIRPWEVLDPQVLDLLFVVKREDFAPAAYRNLAFADMEIPIGSGQVMLAPRIEARLLALYQAEPDGVIADALATTLAKGSDAASGDAVKARLLKLEPKNRGGHLRALQLGTAPWVRPTLLDLAGRDDPDRTAALKILIHQGPAADWMRVCVQIFEATPARDPNDPVWGKWNIYQEPCREWASKEAGSAQDATATLARVQAWLAAHPSEPSGP